MNIFKDSLEWIGRDLRQLALSYFDPVIIIGRNIADYVSNVNDSSQAKESIELLKTSDENTPNYERRDPDVYTSSQLGTTFHAEIRVETETETHIVQDITTVERDGSIVHETIVMIKAVQEKRQ